MPISLSTIEEKMDIHAEVAAAVLVRIGSFDQEDLDEVVIDACCKAAASDVNDGAEDGIAYGLAEETAASINNEGPEMQIAALLALDWSQDDIHYALNPHANPAP